MNEKILTKNPDPDKKGVRIDKDRYDFIHDEIISTLKDNGPLSAMELVDEVNRRLGGDKKAGFSVDWYATAIRLDMEARGEILYNRGDKKPVISLS